MKEIKRFHSGSGMDEKGNNNWKVFKTVSLEPGEAVHVPFGNNEIGEWVRVSPDKQTKATVHFYYAAHDTRSSDPDILFNGLAHINENTSSGGLLWGLGNNRRKLGVLAGMVSNESFTETGYYELDSLMNLVKREDPGTATFIREKFAIPSQVVSIDNASVLVTDNAGRRWRLPKGDPEYSELTAHAVLRICREVATERDLFSCAGTFYELPAENADGYAKIRPVASHHFRIHDYASYRGLLIMTGLQKDLPGGNDHIIQSADGKAAVWAGVIDDLWKMGKPVGEGGPWKDSDVKAGVPSDPYLIGFYDQRSLKITHGAGEPVSFKIEVDPIGHGPWMTYKGVTVKPGESFDFVFPGSFQSRWIRFVADKDCNATAWLNYK
ncbi:MAG: hypothetical protein AB2L24_19305 [Mangrovibacterium sp.]